MAQALNHRGPDASGIWCGGEIGLAHTRLKILDPSDRAAQPMQSASERTRLTFNGAIYNHRGIRKGLEHRGVRFRSHSDTEVLVEGYDEYGESIVDRLEGMFAIAIWDAARSRLLLVRDRAGEKPLFFLRLPNGGVAFASEIKALLAVPALEITRDLEQIGPFLLYGYVPPPLTFYKDVEQLPPAHMVSFGRREVARPRRYWRASIAPSRRYPSYNEAREELRSRVQDVVRDRLDVDVPVGAFLSGGLDSSTVVGVATRLLGRTLRTFSVGVDDPGMDESNDARLSASHFGTVHEQLVVTYRDMPSVELLVHHYDGPFADSSAIPTYLVSKLAGTFVKAVLTGDGGDEIFAGYPRFVGGALMEHLPRWAASAGGWIGRIPSFVHRDRVQEMVHELGRRAAALKRPVERSLLHWLAVLPMETLLALPGTAEVGGVLEAIGRLAAAARHPLPRRMLHWSSIFSVEALQTLLVRDRHAAADAACFNDAPFSDAGEQSPLARMLLHNFETYLPQDLLVKVDRCSMAASLEARSPLLDSGLIDFMGQLPDSYKINALTSKRILRDTFADVWAPGTLYRPKRGFGVPLERWFSGPLRKQLTEALRPSSAEIYRHLDRQVVERLLWSEGSQNRLRWHQAWTLWTLEVWLRQSHGARLPEAA